jgi:hypothetical protein
MNYILELNEWLIIFYKITGEKFDRIKIYNCW